MKSIKQIYHKLSLHILTHIHIYVYTRASLVAQTVKNLPAMWKTWVWNPGLGRYPGEGNGYPLQYSSLKNSMDCVVHGIAKSWTRLSDSLSLWYQLGTLMVGSFGQICILIDFVCLLFIILFLPTCFYQLLKQRDV